MGYLAEYDQGSPLFEKIAKAVAAALLFCVAAYGVYWLFFRNWREEGQTKLFLTLLQNQQYEQAYEAWGCSDAEPCRYYPYGEFLEDWGADSPLGKVETFRLGRSYTQESGVILELTVNGRTHDNLFVNRETQRISFFPYASK